MPIDVYKKIGALFPLLASADDAQVGSALEQIDAALAQADLSWAQLGEKVSRLGSPTGPGAAPDPRRLPVNGSKRPPSQWAIDRADIVRLFEHVHAEGAPNEWVEQFANSVHDWVVGQGRSISDRQREILHEKLDQLGL